MAKYLYIVDTRTEACWAWNKGKPLTKPGENDVYLITVRPEKTRDQILDSIKRWSSTGSIEILRIMGHGRPGYFQMGRLGVSVPTVDWFAKFADNFASNGIIELHCCKVAGATASGAHPGDDLCQLIAQRSGVSVIAGEVSQFADADWKFDGLTRTYKPWRTVEDLPPLGQRPGQ